MRNDLKLEARVMNTIRDYRGIPLTVDDVHDVLRVQRSQVRTALDFLTRAGFLVRRDLGASSVWFDPKTQA